MRIILQTLLQGASRRHVPCSVRCAGRLGQAGGKGERRELLACTHPHLSSSNAASLHETRFWQQQELGCIHGKMVWKCLTSGLWLPRFASPGAFLKAIYSEVPGGEPVTAGSRWLTSRALPQLGTGTGCSARAAAQENQNTPPVLANLHNRASQEQGALS